MWVRGSDIRAASPIHFHLSPAPYLALYPPAMWPRARPALPSPVSQVLWSKVTGARLNNEAVVSEVDQDGDVIIGTRDPDAPREDSDSDSDDEDWGPWKAPRRMR